MRKDAKSLLDRLNRRQFRYQDFTEAAEEIELWPLFQAVLRDPRVVGTRLVHEHQSPPRPQERAEDVTPASRAAPAKPSSSAAGLFDAYSGDADGTSGAAAGQDLRQFLTQIRESRS